MHFTQERSLQGLGEMHDAWLNPALSRLAAYNPLSSGAIGRHCHCFEVSINAIQCLSSEDVQLERNHRSCLWIN